MSLQLHDPHAYLGAHLWDGGVVVRAYRPDASRVVARPEDGSAVELLPAGDGVFEGVVEGADLPLRYELEVAYPDGNTFTQRDAYAFPPTLGELDTYLVGEGRHEQLYERLGVLSRHFDDLRRRLDGAVQAYNSAAASFEARVLPGARKLRDLNVTTAAELPAVEPIDTVPRTLKQAGLLELEEAALDHEIT